jgi:hypothetical protein
MLHLQSSRRCHHETLLAEMPAMKQLGGVGGARWLKRKAVTTSLVNFGAVERGAAEKRRNMAISGRRWPSSVVEEKSSGEQFGEVWRGHKTRHKPWKLRSTVDDQDLRISIRMS